MNSTLSQNVSSLCKAVIPVIGPDVMEVAGSSQLCAGQDEGVFGGCLNHQILRLSF